MHSDWQPLQYSLPLPIDSGTWRAVRSLRGGSFPNSPADPDASALVDPWCGQVCENCAHSYTISKAIHRNTDRVSSGA